MSPAKARGDLLIAVERDVEREVRRAPCRAISRTSSWIGLPSVMPQVALRMADARGVVQGHHRLEAGQPRRHHLRPAAEAGKEVRLDEAGGDADVGVQPLAIQDTGTPVDVRADATRATTSSRPSWLMTRQRRARSRPSMRSSSAWRVRAVRAGGDEDGDVLVPDAGHLREQRLSICAPRLRPGDVAHGDGDPLARPRPDPRSGGAVDRVADGREQRRVRVRRRRPRDRLDDGDAFVWELDVEAVGAVVEAQFQRIRAAVESCAHRCRGVHA